MTVTHHAELPPDKEAIHRRAVRLEWITIAYLTSAVIAIYFTLGASQAMKAVWFEDLLSLVPPIAFLIASRVRRRQPDDDFPYGYHRAVGISYLTSSLALLGMGFFILYDSVTKLIAFEHPPIGVVQPWGEPIWLGWFMLPALVWSGIPAAILGRKKLPLANELHDKVLFADAEMNKADWLTATAGIAGVIGIALGLWWADATAASFISFEIARDGWRNLQRAVGDLMDARPKLVDGSARDPLTTRVRNALQELPWVDDVQVRLRDEGHVFFGEATIVPRDGRDLVSRLDEARELIRSLSWKLHDVIVTVARSSDEDTRED
ncbi:MAG TPA: cation transporter [Actinomycetota bacterium]|nr:cation transporter [Actinomycetota bacterium]